MKCRKYAHVLVLHVVSVEETAVAGIDQDHGSNRDNNGAENSAYFTLGDTL
jgi:hypothetical protein